MRQVSCLDEDFRAGIAGGCVAVLSAESCREGEMDAVAGAGQGCVWVCTDVRAGRANLPYWLHLVEVIFLV
jgi:hypothetical protein